MPKNCSFKLKCPCASGAALLAALACLAVSCSPSKGAWLSSYVEARDEARKTGKDALLCFTGSDWDEAGGAFLSALDEGGFADELSARFVLCKLDIPRNPDLMESEQLEENFLLAGRYAVEDFPFVVLLTSQGDVYGRGALRQLAGGEAAEEEAGNEELARQAIAFVASFDENRENLLSLKAAIEEAEGAEKARRIDAFLASVDPTQYSEYEGLIRSVPALDPENESGLKGAYLLQAAWLDAAALFQAGNMDEAASRFTGMLSDPAMTPSLKQEALYLAAGMYAAASSAPAEKIISLLEEAVAADPESPNVEMISQIIEGISLQIEEAEAQER